MLEEYLMLEKIDDVSPKQWKDLQGLYSAVTNGDVDLDSVFKMPPKSGGSKLNERSDDSAIEEAFS